MADLRRSVPNRAAAAATPAAAAQPVATADVPPTAGLAVDLVATRPAWQVTVRFTARPGHPVALVGPNGSGKTTVLRCIAGLRPIDAGRITLGALVLDDPDDATFRPPQARPVGLMFQEHRLFPFLDVAANVAFGLRATGVPERQVRRRVAATLERFDLSRLAGRKIGTLSGGESQRVALARTLVTEPAVLLLDEPFAAFDRDQRARAREMLAGHLAEFPGPAILVSHDPADAAALGAEVIALDPTGSRPAG